MNPLNFNVNAQNTTLALGQQPGVTASDILDGLNQRFDALADEHERMMDAAQEGEVIDTPLRRREDRLAVQAVNSPQTTLRAYLQALIPLTQLEENGQRISCARSTSAAGAVMMTLLDTLHPAVMSQWDMLAATTKEAWIEFKFAATGEPYDADSTHNDWRIGGFS